MTTTHARPTDPTRPGSGLGLGFVVQALIFLDHKTQLFSNRFFYGKIILRTDIYSATEKFCNGKIINPPEIQQIRYFLPKPNSRSIYTILSETRKTPNFIFSSSQPPLKLLRNFEQYFSRKCISALICLCKQISYYFRGCFILEAAAKERIGLHL